MLENNDFQILIFSEHWLKSENISLVKIPYFELANQFCRKDAKHGGTCIYVNEKLKNFEQMNNLDSLSIEFDFELSSIKFCNDEIIICSLYRSPDGNIDVFFEKLEELLQILSENSKNRVAIAGDFNINFLIQNHISTQCQDIFASFGYQQQIYSPTRECKNSKTCIDNIFVNFESTTSKVINLHLSDHFGIETSLHIKPETHYIHTRFRSKVNENNIEKVKSELQKIEWLKILDKIPDKNKFEAFFDIFDKIVSSTMPVKEKKNNKNKKQQQTVPKDENCFKQKNLCKLYFDMSKDFPNNAVFIDLYKEAKENYLKSLSTCIKNSNGEEILNSKNPQKTMFSIINKNSNHKKRNNTVIEEMYCNGNEKTKNNQKIVDILNENYVNVPQDIHNNLSSKDKEKKEFRYIENMKKNLNGLLFFTPVTEEEILKLINNMSNSTANDMNCYSPKLIKSFAQELSVPLAYLINNSFETGNFPDLLKISKTMPIFKNGDKLDPNNYRPIAILPVFSKIFEKAMYIRIVNFFQDFDLFNKTQHGFRKNRSTVSGIFEIVENF